ncbi:hypothetical protein E4T47_07204 [Aureobasidium subglaciale]|nr:hypothetical protein E4T47_07204 [Aureobasidium subglaciale]
MAGLGILILFSCFYLDFHHCSAIGLSELAHGVDGGGHGINGIFSWFQSERMVVKDPKAAAFMEATGKGRTGA